MANCVTHVRGSFKVLVTPVNISSTREPLLCLHHPLICVFAFGSVQMRNWKARFPGVSHFLHTVIQTSSWGRAFHLSCLCLLSVFAVDLLWALQCLSGANIFFRLIVLSVPFTGSVLELVPRRRVAAGDCSSGMSYFSLRSKSSRGFENCSY